MRLHWGAVPNSPDFIPSGHWRPLREPSPWLMQLFALPIGIAAGVGAAILWTRLTPLQAESMLLPPVHLIALVLGLVIVHELLHAAVHPMSGRSPRSILGFWPSAMAFYAVYDGELTRNRFVAILVMPLVALSLLPLLLASTAQVAHGWTAAASTLNALFACGDLLATGLILSQVPADAIVRNQGWHTYWRPEQELPA